MPKHLFLPVLVDANIGEPERTGQWASHDRKILLGIADGIIVDESARTRGVSSVPDPWARALMFRAAIRPGSRHPLRRRLLQEWRGLLSVLALYRLHSYKVEIVPVPLSQRGRFTESLFQLRPAGVELERGKRYEWTDVLMVRVEGVPVGALSPGTLVYTGADYSTALREKKFALADEAGFLRPPETPDDRLHLAKWLYQLKARLNGGIFHTAQENRGGSGVIQDLNRLLNDWLAELGGGASEADGPEAPDVQVSAESAEPARETRLIERYTVYRELLRPLDWAGQRERHSELGLRMQRNRPGYQEVVVITPHLLASEAKVWDSKRSLHLGGDARTVIERHFTAASGTLIDREDISKHRSLWIRPERYFLSDTLLAARDGASLLGVNEGEINGGRRFILPFRREILDFFSPEYVRDTLRPAFRETESEVVFSFLLPVGTGGTMERVERAYRKKNPAPEVGTMRTVEPPVLDLFPDYLGSQWRRYYLFQATTAELHVNPVLLGDKHRVATRQHTDPETRARVRVTEITGDTDASDGVRTSSPFPEAMEILSGAERAEPVGLVLLATPEEPHASSRMWRVGVDFGTSNTNVFRQYSEAENAERWEFHFPRHLRPVTAVEDSVRDPLLERFFVPNRVVGLPVPTLLRMYQDTRREHMLLDYFIPFDWQYRLPQHVYSDLKWDDQDRRTEYFLESLGFLLLTEVAAQRIRTVDLACSFPKAFSMNSVTVFRGEWERVLRRLLDDPERVVNRHRSGEAGGGMELLGPAFEVEGKAAGEFFASPKTIPDVRQRAKKQLAAVCLDVGGGTTDISIWYRNEIVLDASILLAGRQISRLLQRNLRLLEKLFTDEATAALHERQNEPGLFAARLNVVLRQEDARIRDMLLKHATHQDVLWLRRMLAVEFCAIAFFTTSLLGAASRTPKGRGLLDEIHDSGIALHWGGNAAKFINWIDFGRYDPDGIAAKLLNATVFNGLRDLGGTVRSDQLGQMQSPGHKSEAAGGLVVMSLDRRTRVGPSSAAPADEFDMGGTNGGAAGKGELLGDGIVVSGENVELEDRSVGWQDTVSERVLFEGDRTLFRRTTLERLNRFVEVVNHFGIKYGLLTDDTRIRLDRHAQVIRDNVRINLVEAASLREGQRPVEPVFVSEVRLLMDLLQEEMR